MEFISNAVTLKPWTANVMGGYTLARKHCRGKEKKEIGKIWFLTFKSSLMIPPRRLFLPA
jgi:ABC-type glycerol-3-phosphate transport system permease component